MSPLSRWAFIVWLRSVAAWDRLRLRRLMRRHPGLEIHPDAAPALASASFDLYPGARVTIGPGVVTERRGEGVRIAVRSGGELVIGAGTWLRSDLEPVRLYVYENARMVIGPDCFLNGATLSAKAGITLGESSWIGPGSRVWDSDQHDLDRAHPEQSAPVEIGHHVWIAADCTVLRGVSIGDESVVGTRSLVTRSIPAGSLAYGQPATARSELAGRVGVKI